MSQGQKALKGPFWQEFPVKPGMLSGKITVCRGFVTQCTPGTVCHTPQIAADQRQRRRLRVGGAWHPADICTRRVRSGHKP